MSFGFLNNEDSPAIWRGPMVARMTQQFFDNVKWGKLDFLIIDLPPGTGDIQLTLVQKIQLTGAVIITTPQDLALADVRKGSVMFKKVNVDILGIVENMSYFICNNCNQKHYIFSKDGVKKEAEEFNIPFLGEIPIDTNLRIQSDNGIPALIDNPNGEISKKFISIAKNLKKQLD